MLDVIRMWWHGPLHHTCQLSLASFVAHQHPVQLWTYMDPESLQLPAGVIHRDAREVVPESVFRRWIPQGSGVDQRSNRLPTFANYFRYRLIHDLGGWWCDLDTVCLRPFVFDSPYVFCGRYFDKPEMQQQYAGQLINGVFKAPAGGILTAALLKATESAAVQGEDPGWGVWGPKLFTQCVYDCQLQHYQHPEHIFTPFAPGETGYRTQYLDPAAVIPSWAYAVHCWNRYTMDRTSSVNSIYDRLSRRYLCDR